LLKVHLTDAHAIANQLSHRTGSHPRFQSNVYFAATASLPQSRAYTSFPSRNVWLPAPEGICTFYMGGGRARRDSAWDFAFLWRLANQPPHRCGIWGV